MAKSCPVFQELLSVVRTGWNHEYKENLVCIELWEVRSMYQAMREPCTGSQTDSYYRS
jgi:hypothetical protein